MGGELFATKSNLIGAKRSMKLAGLGYDLMERKRNILVREMMDLAMRARNIRGDVISTYLEAHTALQKANITLGICSEFSLAIPVDTSLSLNFKSVMGVEVPILDIGKQNIHSYYGLNDTNSLLDEAYVSFDKLKRLTVELAEAEHGIYRLADAVRKTQKRANALNNIIIPRLKVTIKRISNSLEEKEREEFSRLKVIKTRQDN